jgi:5-oxoprolinase (ATP-hydrolysing)
MAPWDIAIDVGGTFTDCIGVAPDGTTHTRKVLSSGVTKGVLTGAQGDGGLSDAARIGEPRDFWRGARLVLLGPEGAPREERRITRFDGESGGFWLEGPPLSAAASGAAYELHTGQDAPLLGVRLLLGVALDAPLPPTRIRLGTTRGTNALLTRRGARTAFVTTRGLGDVLHIGTQARPQLFELAIRKPAPLFERVIEVDERLAADGTVLIAPSRAAVRDALAQARRDGIETLAICLLHADRNDVHERLVAAIAREVGFVEPRFSAEVAPIPRLLWRGETTVLDAYLQPILYDYLERVRAGLGATAPVAGDPALRLMTSSGGLVAPASFTGKDAVLSGPAGGAVGVAHVAALLGIDAAIGFDMGGTSTDVCRVASGRVELTYESEKAGVRIAAPMVAIETVAAGGGSVCWFDGVRLRVGPDSAGAEPGPACYGRGGPLTVTDLNLLLGRIPARDFPFPLDVAAAERRIDALREAVLTSPFGRAMDREELALGLLAINGENVVRAIRAITSQRGVDPRGHALVAFGGAGPQHACDIARRLGIRRVVIHPFAGLLSAFGLVHAEVRRRVRRGAPFRDVHASAALEALFLDLEREARDAVVRQGVPAGEVSVERAIDLRYAGQDAFLTLAPPLDGDYARVFSEEHRRLFGYAQEGRELELVAAHVEAVGRRAALATATPHRGPETTSPRELVEVHFGGAAPRSTPLWTRDALRPGLVLEGPAIVCQEGATVLVEPGFRLEAHASGVLLLDDVSRVPAERGGTELDPVRLALFTSRFTTIAEEMGNVLRRTASSVNVKERLDFSAAIFTAEGDLVVNAPHIPVHLGAMSETVRSILREVTDLGPGDVVVTNDPYRGGSHLPDVTVVSPVHDRQGARLFFVANRAHHAEIGGIVPGSMPPASRSLADEGVVLRHFKLVHRGVAREDELLARLREGPHPSRRPADNLADLRAQLAANQAGARTLLTLCDELGTDVVRAYMKHLEAASAARVRLALGKLGTRRLACRDHLDDGTPLAVTIDIADGMATIDFTGTGPVSAGNLNANRAITCAAVLYVVRCLLDDDVPLNAGVLEPIRILIPRGSLLDPAEGIDAAHTPAVVGGNVETSQRIVDVLLGAFGLAAASQGTMNNLTFGDATFGYYETLCGGAGATPDVDGADAVHTHMTNTRLTDVEVLERRFPVRLWRFAIRAGSGGAGVHRGGCGIVRELEALAPLSVSLLTERRGPYAPFGLSGGGPGALGVNRVIRQGRPPEDLPAKVSFEVTPGDRIVIETPGGGGYGAEPAQGSDAPNIARTLR